MDHATEGEVPFPYLNSLHAIACIVCVFKHLIVRKCVRNVYNTRHYT